jgi:hypothetical protein
MIGDSLLLCPKQIGFANLFYFHARCPFWPIDKTYPTGYPKDRIYVRMVVEFQIFRKGENR